MHHLFNRGNSLRLSVFFLATALVLALGYQPGDDAARRPVADGPHAATMAVPAQSIAPHVVLSPTPAPRPQRKRTIDGKNMRKSSARTTAGEKHSSRSKPRVGDEKAGKRTAKQAGRKAARKAPKPKRAYVPGQDISWPQCGGQPMPYKDIRFLVIGLTNGPSFTRNPCVGNHLDWARRHHTWTAAYAFATFPHDWQIRRLGDTGPYDGRHWLGRVQNTAWKTAIFNIRTMREHRFQTPHIWIDVEQSSSRPWTGNKHWNRAVLDAWISTYQEAGYSVGIYSSRNIWHGIMGDYRTRLPEWRTAGPASSRAALGRCRESSFQGGHGIMAQWWDDRRDYDRMCPGFQGDQTMRQFFHKY